MNSELDSHRDVSFQTSYQKSEELLLKRQNYESIVLIKEVKLDSQSDSLENQGDILPVPDSVPGEGLSIWRFTSKLFTFSLRTVLT